MQVSENEVCAALEAFDPAEQFLKELWKKGIPIDKVTETMISEIRAGIAIQEFTDLQLALNGVSAEYAKPALTRHAINERIPHDPSGVYEWNTLSGEARTIRITKHLRYSQGLFHSHDYFELAFLYSGTGEQTFRIDGQEVAEQLGLYDMIIVPPGIVHRVDQMNDAIMLNIMIDRDTFYDTFISVMPKGNKIFRFFVEALFGENRSKYIVFRAHADAAIRRTVLNMLLENIRQDPYALEMMNCMLSIFFLQILRHSEEDIVVSSTQGADSDLVSDVLKYLEANCASASLTDTAARFGYTPEYLNRTFKKSTGTTVLKYIQKIRLKKAVNMLTDTDLSVSEICTAAGYNDSSYFAGLFKREFGTTPLAYRRAMQNRTPS